MKKEYINAAVDAFRLAHIFTDMKYRLDAEYGSFWGTVKNMFKRLNYHKYHIQVIAFKLDFDSFKNRLETLSRPSTPEEERFQTALIDYVTALSSAIEVYMNKVEFLLLKAANKLGGKSSFSDFKDITDKEWAALKECQRTGDYLTELYNKRRLG